MPQAFQPTLTKEQIERRFHEVKYVAAAQLGVTRGCLDRHCLFFGITEWPQRKMRTLMNRATEAACWRDNTPAGQMVNKLEEACRQLEKNPALKLSEIIDMSEVNAKLSEQRRINKEYQSGGKPRKDVPNPISKTIDQYRSKNPTPSTRDSVVRNLERPTAGSVQPLPSTSRPPTSAQERIVRVPRLVPVSPLSERSCGVRRSVDQEAHRPVPSSALPGHARVSAPGIRQTPPTRHGMGLGPDGRVDSWLGRIGSVPSAYC